MKICSLLPSGTEILYELGLEDSITGVSDLCDFPPQVRDKPIVSRSKVDPSVLSSEEVEAAMNDLLRTGENPYELDHEWLARESPDVILTQDLCHVCEVDAGLVNAVIPDMLVQPEVLVLQPRTFEDILGSIHQVGQACQVPEKASQLVQSMRDRVSRVQQSLGLKLAGGHERPRVLSIEGLNPLVIGGHWIPDLLEMAGGKRSMFEPGCAAARIQWETIRNFAPDKLFVDLCSSDLARNLREIPWLAEQAGWNELPAVVSGEVYLVDHSYFSRPGPRVIQGLEILAQLTHPDVFSGLVPAGVAAKLDAKIARQSRPQDIAGCFLPYR